MREILTNRFFPSLFKKRLDFSNRVVLGLGSNLKNPLKILKNCFLYFKNHSRIGKIFLRRFISIRLLVTLINLTFIMLRLSLKHL